MKIKKKLWQIYRKINKLPKDVKIEACSICNLNCRDCYMRNTAEKMPIIGSGYLKFKDYKNFIDKHPYIESVELSFAGEIFLNPELLEIIKYSFEKDIKLTALNGVNFNEISDETLEALVKYQFTVITFSIDAVTNETYQIYRRRGNLNKVIENIEKLNYYKEKYNSIYPILQWQYIVFKHNISEIAGVKDLAQKLKISNIRFKRPWNGEVELNELSNTIKKIIISIYRNNKYYHSRENTNICHQIYLQPQINWDGMLLGCYCSTYNNLDVNVFKVGLKRALNSKKMKYMKNVIQGKVNSDESIACHKCCYFQIMKAQNKYINTKDIKFT